MKVSGKTEAQQASVNHHHHSSSNSYKEQQEHKSIKVSKSMRASAHPCERHTRKTKTHDGELTKGTSYKKKG